MTPESTPKQTPPRAPTHLGTAGKRLWRTVAGHYVLRADELTTLEDVCELTDMLAALSVAWADLGKPLTTLGSVGQVTVHPLVAEMRAHRMSRNVLWRHLALPDGPEGAAARSQQRTAWGRQMARERWGR
jgi:phage terminase small subunit